MHNCRSPFRAPAILAPRSTGQSIAAKRPNSYSSAEPKPSTYVEEGEFSELMKSGCSCAQGPVDGGSSRGIDELQMNRVWNRISPVVDPCPVQLSAESFSAAIQPNRLVLLYASSISQVMSLSVKSSLVPRLKRHFDRQSPSKPSSIVVLESRGSPVKSPI